MARRAATEGKPYHSDHNTIYSCQYHVIFCPRYRGCILAHVVAFRLKVLLLEKQAE
jgi:putative transposase